jgi:DNA-binding NarL/FixJ family response regulator
MTSQASLTASEHRVATLLLEGLTNRDIACRLVVSPRTVESHVSRALAKTGCRNRLELALWMLTMTHTPA